MTRALVYGLAIAGKALARSLVERGYELTVADDQVSDDKRAAAEEIGVELIDRPGPDRIDELVRWSDLVAPAPGVPETHPVVIAALLRDRPLRTEIDLAYEWEQQRPGGPRPMLAITGTDGKTTTTLLAAAMIQAHGSRAAAVGNTEVPLVEALDDDSIDVFVVECSSFRLSWTTCFRPDAAVWLNLAPDHLNWHRDLASYISAKSRIWMYQHEDDTAIGFADDPIVMAELRRAPGRQITFGLEQGDYHCAVVPGSGPTQMSPTLMSPTLMSPSGPICAVGEMRRALPHDISNALAAAALAQQSGRADTDAIARALRTFVGPPHRLEAVGEGGGVRWFNDSKATTPHAAITAIRAFDSLVLIAGGRNKGLDLSELGSEQGRMRGVVAIGEAADVIAGIFQGSCPVVRATSMAEAVALAADLAVAGDAVVLSPACASFDWYPDGGYPARGDDFRERVADLLGSSATQAHTGGSR